MRDHSTENRYVSKPSAATRAMSSAYRCRWSQASPLGSTHGVSGVCSNAHQSLATLPPSTWWAEVAVPQQNPEGKVRMRRMGPCRQDPDKSVDIQLTDLFGLQGT